MGGGRGSFHCVTTYIIVAPAAAKSGGGSERSGLPDRADVSAIIL